MNTLTTESAITPTPSSTPTTVSYNNYEKTPTSEVHKMWSTGSYFTMLATVTAISGKHEMASAIGYDQDYMHVNVQVVSYTKTPVVLL